MLKTKRIMTDSELDMFLKLREESNIKGARYMKSLESELFEVRDIEDYGVERRGSTKVTKSRSINKSIGNNGNDAKI